MYGTSMDTHIATSQVMGRYAIKIIVSQNLGLNCVNRFLPAPDYGRGFCAGACSSDRDGATTFNAKFNSIIFFTMMNKINETNMSLCVTTMYEAYMTCLNVLLH